MATTDSAVITDLVVIRRTVRASAEAAFRAWTDPEAIRQWGAPATSSITHASVDLRVGGRYEQHMRAANGFERRVAGTYLEIDAPTRLVYTWRWEQPPEAYASQVTVEFIAIDGGTEVVVTHALLADDTARTNHAKGWNGCLEKFVATLNAVA